MVGVGVGEGRGFAAMLQAVDLSESYLPVDGPSVFFRLGSSPSSPSSSSSSSFSSSSPVPRRGLLLPSPLCVCLSVMCLLSLCAVPEEDVKCPDCPASSFIFARSFHDILLVVGLSMTK